MANRPSIRSVLVALASARDELRGVNVRFLEEEDFGRAQEVTALLQDLKRLEDRVGQVEAAEGASTRADQPMRIVDEGEANGAGAARYFRRGDVIVKIGQKRGQTGTYEQKLPRRQFEEVRDVLIDLAQAGAEFEAKRPIDRATVPAYQVYLLLNVLERQGVVKTPSRGRYRFPRPLGKADFEAVWARVPEDAP